MLLSPRGWSSIYNQEQLLRAYALARPSCRKPAVLMFVRLPRTAYAGESARLVERARQQARDLGLSDSVYWLPELRYELMPGFYALGDIVLNCPSEDSLAMTLIEAAACEAPIITARLPAYADTFVEQYCTLVEPGQPAALAAAIVATVNQPTEERVEQLRAARRAVEEQYDDRVVRARPLQLYDEVADAYRRQGISGA